MRILVLTPDAYGGRGGIALYNRDVIRALAEHPECREVRVLPRHMVDPPGPLPQGVTLAEKAAGGKRRYVAALARLAAFGGGFDRVICGHLNLLPLAVPAAFRWRAPVTLFLYGIDAWTPPRSRLARRLAHRPACAVAISDVTRRRFLGWSGLPAERVELLPNAIHADAFGAGPRPAHLAKRYRLEERRVLLTLGRLEASERYKGIDEVIDVLPRLLQEVPDVAYLVVGDGSDKERLVQRARDRGLAQRVVFAGRIPEEEKADHFRLADAYVMPSSGEGFGFVFLEALACGVPAVGSRLDGGREALREGQLGALVDPRDPEDLYRGILAALATPRGEVPEGLAYFSYEEFRRRLHGLLERCPPREAGR